MAANSCRGIATSAIWKVTYWAWRTTLAPILTHILVCFLALVMWRTLQHWMQTWGLGTAPRKLLEEMAEVHSLDVVLPTRTGREICLRTISRPEKHLAILLQRLGLPLPNRSKRIQNVVQTFTLKIKISSKTGTSKI